MEYSALGNHKSLAGMARGASRRIGLSSAASSALIADVVPHFDGSLGLANAGIRVPHGDEDDEAVEDLLAHALRQP